PFFDSTDQRGAPRIKNGAVDIGAIESGPTTIQVTTFADRNTGTINPGSGAGTSLRDAIAFANTDFYADTITFSPLVMGRIDLTHGALAAITGALTITGPGADVLTIDGQNTSRILSIGTGANVTISGLTLADGSAPRGGGIQNGGTLSLVDCTLSGNSATF